MRTMLSAVCCLMLPLSCENNWPPTHVRSKNESIKEAHSLALLNVEEIDTLDFYYADYFPFYVKFPFKIDTSYFRGGYCGNEPKCKTYKNFENNVEINVCQFWSQYPVDYSIGEIETNLFTKQIRQLKKLYNGKTNHIFAEQNQVVNGQGDSWVIGGLKVTSDNDDHSLLLHSMRKEIDRRYTHLSTYFTMKYVKTKICQTNAIDQAKFICKKSKLHRVNR